MRKFSRNVSAPGPSGFRKVGNVSAPGPSGFREMGIMSQLQAPPAFAYRSAGGSAAVGGSAAAAWQRRRFGVSSAFAYRSAYRSAYPGTYPCLSQVTDMISMEVPVSQLLAFQTHVTPQLLVLLPLSFSVIKCFCIFCSFLFSWIYNKSVSLSHSLSELIGEKYTTRLFDKLKLAYLVRV